MRNIAFGTRNCNQYALCQMKIENSLLHTPHEILDLISVPVDDR